MPDRVSGLFAELLHVLEEGLRRGAIGVVLVGAELDLFLVVMLLGILAYVVFLTEAQRTQQENAIVEKEKSAAELRRKYFGQEGELAKKQQELMQPILDDIYEVVKAIAQNKGYSMVIDRASASSIIFASPNIDISDDVLAELGE